MKSEHEVINEVRVVRSWLIDDFLAEWDNLGFDQPCSQTSPDDGVKVVGDRPNLPMSHSCERGLQRLCTKHA